MRGTRDSSGLSFTGASGTNEGGMRGNLHSDEWTAKPGEVIDWGDVRPKPLE
jgi:hypothetical protein